MYLWKVLEDQVNNCFAINGIFSQRFVVLKRFSRVDEVQLKDRNGFAVGNFGLDASHKIFFLDVQTQGLAGLGLDEDEHVVLGTDIQLEGS